MLMGAEGLRTHSGGGAVGPSSLSARGASLFRTSARGPPHSPHALTLVTHTHTPSHTDPPPPAPPVRGARVRVHRPDVDCVTAGRKPCFEFQLL